MKPKKLLLKIGLLCSAVLLFAFIPKSDDPIDKLVAALQKWADTNPQEKVYLQTDKPYYALGDTIWFKGYVTVGSRHQLSALSHALYVDLITQGDSLVRTLKLPITTGMVIGDFALGDDLKPGSYRIRAYTQWMRNAGDEYFFDKTFTVGDVDNIITKANYQYKTIGGKTILTALLSYTDDAGKAFAERKVKYQIVINKQVVDTRVVQTDALGNLSISIENDKKIDLSGAYIRTILDAKDNNPIVRDFPIKAMLFQSDVQFFPESGNMVNGVACRVAFKAVGVDGLGVDVKGKIVDDGNTQVSAFESFHAGMGSFIMHPEKGKNYTAQVTFADGSTKNIALPKAVDDGFVLGVYQPNKDSILVRINASASQVAATPTLNFIAQTNGEVIVASPVKIARASNSIWLEKKLFPSGITQFTIFTAAGEPLNERIAFIKGNDMMQLNLQSDKKSYKLKEPIKIDLNAKDSKGAPTLGGNFSVSVIDESKAPIDESQESTIFSNLLLSSDIKGYIEKPNYYFATEGDDADKALDNLMLTQGYRRFQWKEILGGNITKPKYEAEKLGATISGTVYNLGNKPLAAAKVTLLSVRANIAQTTTTDADGRFKFENLVVSDSIKFAIQARQANNSDKTLLKLDSIPHQWVTKNKNLADVSTDINATLKAYLDNGKKQDAIYEKSGQLDKVQRLREVRIKARRVKEDANINPQGMFKLGDEQSADQIIKFSEDDAQNAVTLGMALQARIQGVMIQPDAHGQSELYDMKEKATLTMIVDGRQVDGAEASDILDGSVQPSDVAKIEVVRTNMAAKNMLGNNPAGYLLILLKLGSSRREYNPSIINTTPKGYNKVRNFYSPKYDNPNAASYKLPDLRTTVYWNPFVKTNEQGQTSFSFYNADGPGTYKVVVEGINAAGELGRQVYHYTVE
ncbi:carboxypeptidase regulatory-like domain-containing protein [Mucilaginibacter sp. dw_454]|uniref:carboxypeptidase regulatory-like domain-containing protein n=1 Tax=Mucilaginibacter sp. dw_454 TaxID=2720079 RepID=UPI001BD2A7FC|nr:carboxypeptidase regulatory-like domain-containing protein [Mucilaginibacter sp. dw_454]